MTAPMPWPVHISADVSGFEEGLTLNDITGDAFRFGLEFWQFEGNVRHSSGVCYRGGILATYHGVGGVGNQRITLMPDSQYETGGVVHFADPKLDLVWIRPDAPIKKVEARLDADFPSVPPDSRVQVKTGSRIYGDVKVLEWGLDVFVELEPIARLQPIDSGSPVYDDLGFLDGVILSRHPENKSILCAGPRAIKILMGDEQV